MSLDPSDPHDTPTHDRLRSLAERAAHSGGLLAAEHFGRGYEIRLKTDRSEVTDADETVQRAVIACLCSERPDDPVVAEENLESDAATKRRSDEGPGAPPDNGRLCWVVDPIDGTRNYVRGIPLYACSVAVMFGGFPIAGAIYVPATDALYSATQTGAALLNGRPLSIADGAAGRPPGVTPMVGIPSMRHGNAHTIVHTWVDRLVVRNFGSTALHLAMVAAGQIDGALATQCKLWDLAAGWLIVIGAGGTITTPSGQPVFPFDLARYQGEDLPVLAARPDLHPRLVVQA